MRFADPTSGLRISSKAHALHTNSVDLAACMPVDMAKLAAAALDERYRAASYVPAQERTQSRFQPSAQISPDPKTCGSEP